MSDSENILGVLDGYAVSLAKVEKTTGLSREQIDQAMDEMTFPLPTMELNGMPYWRLGDLARFDLGWC